MSEEYPDWQDGMVKVVCNGDRVCSVWPAERENALGWEDVGFSGTLEACLEYVKAHCDGFCHLLPPAESAPEPLQDAPPQDAPPQDAPPNASAEAAGLAAS